MVRPVLRNCLLVTLGVLAWAGAHAAGGADVNPVRQAPPPLLSKRAQELSDKLNQPVTVEFDAGPLKDALGFLQDRYNLPLIVDEEAFKRFSEMPDIQGQQVKLQKAVNIKLRTVLELLLQQLEGGILEKDGIVWVLPQKRLTPKVLLRGLVSASFRNVPLGQALEELSDQAGVSVVIDGRVADQVSKALVIAKLNQVPLDTAVRVLTDSAELKSVVLDNLIYVTSSSHAPHLLHDKARMAPAEK
jgi:hypothetical protein